MTQDDVFLTKWKSAGVADYKIAQKLNISVAEVQRRWTNLVKEKSQNQSNGYEQLCEAYTTLCQQYQLVGESLKTIALALHETMSEQEIFALVGDTKEQTAQNLRLHAIVLRRWTPPPIVVPKG